MKTKPPLMPFEDRYRKGHPFKTLYHLYDNLHRDLVFAILFFIIKHSPVWITPIVIAQVINIVTYPARHPLKDLWFYGALLLVLIVQNIPTHMTHVYFLRKAVRTMETELRSALLRRMQQLSIAFHDDFRVGSLQSKVLRDVESVQILSDQIIGMILPALLGIIFAACVTLGKQPLVMLLYLVTVPLTVVLIWTFRSRVKTRNREFRGELEQMTARVSEMIEMIPLTRAHGVENSEIEKMDQQLHRVQDRGFRLDIVNSLFGATGWVIFQGFQVLCLLVTAFMAYKGRISVGEVVLYQGFFAMIVNAVMMILAIYPQLTRGFESIQSIGEILECPDLEQNEGKKNVLCVSGKFTFENVSFSYAGAGAAAVADFSLSVAPGERIALVGPSGAGKSTILNLIVGFRRPTAGRILLDGEDMQGLDLRQYRHFLAIVPQNTILSSATIRENITYGLSDVPESKLQEAIVMANAADFIRDLPQGLNTAIGEHGGKLSGGQRQRIAIARALIRDPRVILFDEATSSLDIASEMLIGQAMERLAQGRTTFIVAHRLTTIKSAGRIVVMNAGRITEIGAHDELMARRGEFFRLKSLQG
ncbi:MAG: ABC transporter ATP-binding protein [Chitinivibrionales bacterium]|nr:ABC transporter ATP-binding protein [Chitinivibrionales bacterium]